MKVIKPPKKFSDKPGKKLMAVFLPVLHPGNFAPAGVEAAGNRADVVFRRDHLDVHHWFQQFRSSPPAGFPEAGSSTRPERLIGRIDFME